MTENNTIEMVDIVDDDDNIIGQESKDVCHQNKILHRGSAIFCFKDKDCKELLLQIRSKNKKTCPRKICIPGGHIALGESYLDGAKREFVEEMFDNDFNQDLDFEEVLKIKKFTDNDYEYTTLFRTIFSGPFNIDVNEVESYFFEDIKVLFKKIINNPEDYTGTTVLLLKEYEKMFFNNI